MKTIAAEADAVAPIETSAVCSTPARWKPCPEVSNMIAALEKEGERAATAKRHRAKKERKEDGGRGVVLAPTRSCPRGDPRLWALSMEPMEKGDAIVNSDDENTGNVAELVGDIA